MKLITNFLTKNDCYKKGSLIKPVGIVVHSTGANNPYIKRYVQPNKDGIGENRYNNHWNKTGVEKCVHAFIGKLDNGDIATVQTLPWTFRAWGCGKGKKGSYNNSHIQFEICEDELTNATYFSKVYNEAIDLCAKLVKDYKIDINNIVSHHEAHKLGYASNHGDINHWLKLYNLTMDDFRQNVLCKIKGSIPTDNFKVKIACNVLNVREQPNTTSRIVTHVRRGEVYTIVNVTGEWYKLKSGAGWINSKYCTIL